MTLPRSIKEIADLVGIPAALALVKKYGGTDIKFPAIGSPGKVRADLVELLGEGNADLLISHYHGERVTIARCASVERDARDLEIIGKYDSGVTGASLAREYGLAERTVRNILKRVPDSGVGA